MCKRELFSGPKTKVYLYNGSYDAVVIDVNPYAEIKSSVGALLNENMYEQNAHNII